MSGPFGLLWLWGSGEPAWEHALRTALFVVVLLPASYYSARWIRAHRGRPPLPEISLVRIIGAKVSLLVVALIVQYALDNVTSHADQIVAAGLFVVVASCGPLCHRFFMPSKSARTGSAGTGSAR